MDPAPLVFHPQAPREQESALYEIRRKIYPRAVHGVFARWRVAFVLFTQILYYGLPWLGWNDRQAVLFDLAGRKFYLFGLLLWPQDVIYLAVLLILAAFTLFLFTAVAGRLYCGYACPQTVYTEIFMWIERKIEGDRLARMRLDNSARSLEKFTIKAIKHAAWFAVALWTGYTFVGYFTPIRELGVHALTWRLGGWEAFWIFFYTFATYGNAGFLREQVCKYMCPYARFQSVMFDRDTFVITYDAARGEPRGARARSVDPASKGLGACVDCNICVQVCPTGIDIRNGLQHECIGCAACIDGCDQVMTRMGYARGLIRYTTQNALARGLDRRAVWRRTLRPRILVYASALLIGIGATAATLASRNPLKVDVIRDRGVMAREAGPGVIENVYRMQIINSDERARQLVIGVEGLPALSVAGVEQPVELNPAESRLIAVRVQLMQQDALFGAQNGADVEAALKPGTHPIYFNVRSIEEPDISRHEKASFYIPR